MFPLGPRWSERRLHGTKRAREDETRTQSLTLASETGAQPDSLISPAPHLTEPQGANIQQPRKRRRLYSKRELEKVEVKREATRLEESAQADLENLAGGTTLPDHQVQRQRSQKADFKEHMNRYRLNQSRKREKATVSKQTSSAEGLKDKHSSSMAPRTAGDNQMDSTDTTLVDEFTPPKKSNLSGEASPLEGSTLLEEGEIVEGSVSPKEDKANAENTVLQEVQTSLEDSQSSPANRKPVLMGTMGWYPGRALRGQASPPASRAAAPQTLRNVFEEPDRPRRRKKNEKTLYSDTVAFSGRAEIIDPATGISTYYDRSSGRQIDESHRGQLAASAAVGREKSLEEEEHRGRKRPAHEKSSKRPSKRVSPKSPDDSPSCVPVLKKPAASFNSNQRPRRGQYDLDSNLSQPPTGRQAAIPGPTTAATSLEDVDSSHNKSRREVHKKRAREDNPEDSNNPKSKKRRDTSPHTAESASADVYRRSIAKSRRRTAARSNPQPIVPSLGRFAGSYSGPESMSTSGSPFVSDYDPRPLSVWDSSLPGGDITQPAGLSGTLQPATFGTQSARMCAPHFSNVFNSRSVSTSSPLPKHSPSLGPANSTPNRNFGIQPTSSSHIHSASTSNHQPAISNSPSTRTLNTRSARTANMHGPGTSDDQPISTTDRAPAETSNEEPTSQQPKRKTKLNQAFLHRYAISHNLPHTCDESCRHLPIPDSWEPKPLPDVKK